MEANTPCAFNGLLRGLTKNTSVSPVDRFKEAGGSVVLTFRLQGTSLIPEATHYCTAALLQISANLNCLLKDGGACRRLSALGPIVALVVSLKKIDICLLDQVLCNRLNYGRTELLKISSLKHWTSKSPTEILRPEEPSGIIIFGGGVERGSRSVGALSCHRTRLKVWLPINVVKKN